MRDMKLLIHFDSLVVSVNNLIKDIETMYLHISISEKLYKSSYEPNNNIYISSTHDRQKAMCCVQNAGRVIDK